MTAKGYLHIPLLMAAIVAAGCGGTDSQGDNRTMTEDGGEAVVLLAAEYSGSWPTGLDPATNTTARSNLSQMNAIFGGLFQLMPTGLDNTYATTGALAQGYEIEDEGRSIVIRLRSAIEFSDGTALDAEAVR